MFIVLHARFGAAFSVCENGISAGETEKYRSKTKTDGIVRVPIAWMAVVVRPTGASLAHAVPAMVSICNAHSAPNRRPPSCFVTIDVIVCTIPNVRESSPPPDGSSSCNVRRSQSRRFHCRPTARIAAGRDDRVRANLKNPDSSLAPRLIISGQNRHNVYRVA